MEKHIQSVHIDIENFWRLIVEYDFWNDAGLNDFTSNQISNRRLLVIIRWLSKTDEQFKKWQLIYWKRWLKIVINKEDWGWIYKR
jgi:hypothetical protein